MRPQEATNSVTWLKDPACRPVGLETELGVLEPGNFHANPVALASRQVDAYATISRPGLQNIDGAPAPAVRWDYEAEDPLADQRGGHLERAAAHPSLLTDDPTILAPSGDASAEIASAPAARGQTADLATPSPGSGLADLPAGPWGARPRPSAAEAALARATTAVLTNGARLYVDHAHPEYSSPEVLRPIDALIWDRAGEVIGRRAMAALAGQSGGVETVLYKNNVDGKGAAYGSHENYLVRRELPFETLTAALIPFLATRPVLVGAGRVGLGPRSERPGFQISQRADYVGCEVGLQTTFNRPLVNTRDEPHAESKRWRRLHVINGDANMLEVPGYLKVATANLLLWYLERAHKRGLGLAVLQDLQVQGDVVEQHWAMSHDTTLAFTYQTNRGPLTALELQGLYLEAIRAALREDYGGLEATQVGEETARALKLWAEVLEVLDCFAAAQASEAAPAARAHALAMAAPLVEWVAKLQLCEGLLARSASGWEDPRVAALDLQWADLRPGRGVAERLNAAGRTRRLTTDAQIEQAADQPPPGTRAAVRGAAIARFPQVVAASWTSLVLDLPARSSLLRLDLPQDVACSAAETEAWLAAISRTVAAGETLAP
ncbi:Pup deamidase/depupylase [Actinomyces bovis]|uniref:Pup deamidase/depupylase n=1 Tax=Actinomyces bovis TaxID=1658 RepID=A0ABY1VKX0_9ACTO|nr:proteasome accessory factor PafA2 family protein [Actinomyces bovis]SPT52402.1 Pup deamidase/depupylase [Actinomyces bovis]VEG54012.1 Pup deamidase/depupylase [Actinomyces israelii]